MASRIVNGLAKINAAFELGEKLLNLTAILDLARRLKADGNDKAAKQAKVLLDAMLDPTGVAK